jgi:hypothetical protein
VDIRRSSRREVLDLLGVHLLAFALAGLVVMGVTRARLGLTTPRTPHRRSTSLPDTVHGTAS